MLTPGGNRLRPWKCPKIPPLHTKILPHIQDSPFRSHTHILKPAYLSCMPNICILLLKRPTVLSCASMCHHLNLPCSEVWERVHGNTCAHIYAGGLRDHDMKRWEPGQLTKEWTKNWKKKKKKKFMRINESVLLFFCLFMSVVLNHAAGGPQHCLFWRCLLLKTPDFYHQLISRNYNNWIWCIR